MLSVPKCDLEKELFKNVFDKTPDYIKNTKLSSFKFLMFLIDICNKTTSTIMNKKPTHL